MIRLCNLIQKQSDNYKEHVYVVKVEGIQFMGASRIEYVAGFTQCLIMKGFMVII